MITSRYRIWLERGDPADLEDGLGDVLPSLHRQARRVLGNAADADDAVQEACVVLLESRARLPSTVPLIAIARRLTGQLALMAVRARQRRWRRYTALTSADSI